MVPDEPQVDYPVSPWQTVGLFLLCGLIFFLAVWGGIDLAIRMTGWLGGG